MKTRSSGRVDNSRAGPARGGFNPADYFDALYGPKQARITLSSGDELVLERAGLGGHMRLQALAQALTAAPLEERAGYLREWLRAAGLDTGRLDLSDLVPVIVEARRLNAPRGQLAWSALAPPSDDRDPRYTDYPGRALAYVVDTLARHYGWSLEHILELAPEAALLHVQECILQERRRKEWEHYLSDVAWEYDRGSGKSRYKELPPLPWDRTQPRPSKPVPQWVKDKYYPKGVVIKLADRGREDG